MKKLFYGLLAAATTAATVVIPALADPDIPKWKTLNSMGCMMLRECTEGVIKINSIADIEKYYGPNYNSAPIRNEFNAIIKHLNTIGVEVFLADQKYFPPLNRGVYNTQGNKFFLNDSYMDKPGTLMAVTRHEGWHVAQDCMAAGVENNFIAVIYDDDQIPQFYRDMAERNYPESVRPWEQGALWAGHTADVTEEALAVCASGTPMWEVYNPTPMTLEWLEKEGHI